MARKAIGTEYFRARDIEDGDVVLLKLHGQVRWYWVTENAKTKGQTTTITYKTALDQNASTDIGCWELVKVQYAKDPH